MSKAAIHGESANIKDESGMKGWWFEQKIIKKILILSTRPVYPGMPASLHGETNMSQAGYGSKWCIKFVSFWFLVFKIDHSIIKEQNKPASRSSVLSLHMLN